MRDVTLSLTRSQPAASPETPVTSEPATHRDPGEPDSVGPRRSLLRRLGPWGLGLLLFAILVGAHVVLSVFMRVPIIHPDELGYLDNARYLAHGGIKPDTEYYPGFSLLLIPVWLLSKDPLTVWRAALDINAALSGLAAVVTWMLTRRLAPALTPWRRLAVTAIIATYPSFLLYSNLSLAECLFVVMFGFVVLIGARAMTAKNPAWWAALGISAGLLALVHPRGFAVAVAVGLFAILLLRRDHGAASAVGLAAGLTLSLGLTRVLVSATRGATLNGFAAYEPDGIISKSLSMHGAVSLIWEAGGQLFYLSVVTLGLLPLGLYLGGRSVIAVARGDRTGVHLTRAFVVTSFAGIWALSSLFMNLGDRADKLMYGRYNEGAIVPLLVIALADVLAPGRLRHFAGFVGRAHAARRWFLCGVGATALGAAALLVGHSTAELHGDLNPVNVLGLYPLLHHLSGQIDVLAFALIGGAAIAFLALVGWRWPAVSAVVIVAVFIASAIDSETGYLVPGARARADQRVIATTLAAADRTFGLADSCIAYDPSKLTTFNFFQMQFLLPGRRFLWFDSTRGQQPCGPVVVSSDPAFAARFPGARLVTLENNVAQAVWVLPGPVQDRFVGAGWVFPAATPGPLPDPARHAIVRPRRGAPATIVSAGAATTFTVTATHDGGGSPWPSAAGLKQGIYSVALRIAWYRNGQVPASPNDAGAPLTLAKVELPRTVLPGETVPLDVPLVARDSASEPLAPGLYQVRLSVFQEGTEAFLDPGLVLNVVVR